MSLTIAEFSNLHAAFLYCFL